MMHYSILINTCDKFEDCWLPYFKLHAMYWPDCNGQLYLNTETKEFSFPGQNIVSLKVNGADPARRLTWSECLLRALDQIDDDLVLYMQEDYFLKANVKNQVIEQYVDLMRGDTSIHCIHLTDQAVISEGESEYSGLHKVKLQQRYRVSCQAALWRKDVLAAHVRSHESAWQFEEFGSKRSAVLNGKFLVADPAQVRLNESEIIPYIFTGIVQGRWSEEVVPLFDRHDIAVNFAKRGFLKDATRKSIGQRLVHFSQRLPVSIKSSIDLWRMKISSIANR